jgi:hypothetical protein
VGRDGFSNSTIGSVGLRNEHSHASKESQPASAKREENPRRASAKSIREEHLLGAYAGRVSNSTIGGVHLGNEVIQGVIVCVGEAWGLFTGKGVPMSMKQDEGSCRRVRDGNHTEKFVVGKRRRK